LPTNTPIPTATTGTVIPAATQNDMAVLNTMIGLYGAGPAMFSGSAPATTAPNYLVQAGAVGVSFSSGAGTLTFPVAFPNGVLAVLCDVSTNAATSSMCSPSVTVGNGAYVALWGAISGTALNSNYVVVYIAIGY
jgi:hypothetical protein